MATQAHEDALHIAMIPWLAFGHMIPYLELAKHMAGRGHRISFLSTPRNIDRLPKLSPNLEALVEFAKIELPSVENLPENAEATSDLPYDKVQHLKVAYDLLQKPVAGLLASLAPDWVLYDFAPYWVGPIARTLGIKTAQFTIFTAFTLVYAGPPWSSKGGDYRKKPEDFTVAPKWVPFHTSVAFSYFAINKIFDDVIKMNKSGVSDLYRLGAGQEGADIIATRSSYEVEPEWLKVLEELMQKPVFPIGQLPPRSNDLHAEEENEAWECIKQWLDSHNKGSVIYVAFGSEAKPSEDEATQIALGLEDSGMPFFWVMRAQLGSSDKDRIKLPDGFEERVKGRGIVWSTWAPQLKILAHDSVGGFLTHSGWSSVVEALSFGRALILLSFLADQGLNSKFLVEKKMGYAVPRNEFDGSFTSASVSESLRKVMVEKEGCYRVNTKMEEVIRDRQLQEGYVDNFLNYLKSTRPRRERLLG